MRHRLTRDDLEHPSNMDADESSRRTHRADAHRIDKLRCPNSRIGASLVNTRLPPSPLSSLQAAGT
jgi:hypothetical protein